MRPIINEQIRLPARPHPAPFQGAAPRRVRAGLAALIGEDHCLMTNHLALDAGRRTFMDYFDRGHDSQSPGPRQSWRAPPDYPRPPGSAATNSVRARTSPGRRSPRPAERRTVRGGWLRPAAPVSTTGRAAWHRFGARLPQQAVRQPRARVEHAHRCFSPNISSSPSTLRVPRQSPITICPAIQSNLASGHHTRH